MHIAVLSDHKNKAVKIALYYRHYNNYIILCLSVNEAKKLSKKLQDVLEEFDQKEMQEAYYE